MKTNSTWPKRSALKAIDLQILKGNVLQTAAYKRDEMPQIAQICNEVVPNDNTYDHELGQIPTAPAKWREESS